MAKSIKVKENQTLAQIAKDTGFNVDTLIKANPKFFVDHTFLLKVNSLDPKTASDIAKMNGRSLMNPNVLAPTMLLNIPDKKKKAIDQSSGIKKAYTVQRTPKQFLTFTFDDENKEIQQVELTIKGKLTEIIELPDQQTGKRIFRTSDPLSDDLPVSQNDEADNKIKIKSKSVATGEETEKEILINIGGVDPILDPSGNFPKATDNIVAKKAVQKLLRNFGLFTDEIDGDLEKPGSVSAIKNFQRDFMSMPEENTDFGFPTLGTCITLSNLQGIEMGCVQPILNKTSPPPNPVVFPAPTIELIRDNFPLGINSIGFGRFDNAWMMFKPNAFQPAFATLKQPDFVSGDSGSFRIRVIDLSVNSKTIEVDWFTTKNDSPIQSTINTKLTLSRPGPGDSLFPELVFPGTFVSRPLMLVCESVDLGKVDNISSGSKDYRIRLASMFGKVKVNYKNVSLTHEVFNKDHLFNIPVHIFVFRETPNDPPIVSPEKIAELFSLTQDVYETVGIFFNSFAYPTTDSIKPKVEPFTKKGKTYQINIIDKLNFTHKLNDISEIDAITIGTEIIQNPHPIRIFFIEGFHKKSVEGLALNSSFIELMNVPDKNNPKFCLFLDKHMDSYVLAHEIGHLLMDKADSLKKANRPVPSGLNMHHFNSPDSNNLPAEMNLMFDTTTTAKPDIEGAKRIWEREDADKFNQFKALTENAHNLKQQKRQ